MEFDFPLGQLPKVPIKTCCRIDKTFWNSWPRALVNLTDWTKRAAKSTNSIKKTGKGVSYCWQPRAVYLANLDFLKHKVCCMYVYLWTFNMTITAGRNQQVGAMTVLDLDICNLKRKRNKENWKISHTELNETSVKSIYQMEPLCRHCMAHLNSLREGGKNYASIMPCHISMLAPSGLKECFRLKQTKSLNPL